MPVSTAIERAMVTWITVYQQARACVHIAICKCAIGKRVLERKGERRQWATLEKCELKRRESRRKVIKRLPFYCNVSRKGDWINGRQMVQRECAQETVPLCAKCICFAYRFAIAYELPASRHSVTNKEVHLAPSFIPHFAVAVNQKYMLLLQVEQLAMFLLLNCAHSFLLAHFGSLLLTSIAS